jgi:serine/threonine-protein kinase HipA
MRHALQNEGGVMFTKPKLVTAYLNGETVGRLALTPENLCAFEYDSGYLNTGQSISPFYLPLQPGVFIARRDPFSGNFGVFNDSLPDGWGNLLLDRFLNSHKINPSGLSILDRLSLVGSSGMGALEYKPDNSFTPAEGNPELDYLASEAEKILNQKDTGASLDILFKYGGSSGGARPKVLLTFEGEEWLVKFRSFQDPENVGQIEYEYSLLAKDCGIEMPETRLFEGKYFGVKRFDRNGKTKIHMLSAAGLLNADYRIPCLDYQSLLTACFKLTGNIEEVYKLYRIMVFNVLIKNRDDHARNFSFLLKDGKWKLSPAYDLLPGNGFNGFHTTTIAGQGDPNYEDIQKVAQSLGLNKNRAKEIYEITEEKCRNKKKL